MVYKVIRISNDNYEKLLLYQAVLQYMRKKKVTIDEALSDLLDSVTFKNFDEKTLGMILQGNPKIAEKLLKGGNNND
jgi:hypothetical protein